MARRPRHTVRPHPYAASATVPADHNGNRPCVCGRAKANGAHAPADVEATDQAQDEHRRRIGGDA